DRSFRAGRRGEIDARNAERRRVRVRRLRGDRIAFGRARLNGVGLTLLERLAVEVRLRSGGVDLLSDLVRFGLQVRTVARGEEVVRGLDRENVELLQRVGLRGVRPFGRVQRVERVGDVARPLVGPAYLGLQRLEYRKTRRIVGSRVDRRAAGELLKRLLERALMGAQLQERLVLKVARDR